MEICAHLFLLPSEFQMEVMILRSVRLQDNFRSMYQ
jgi:hypothetical protein